MEGLDLIAWERCSITMANSKGNKGQLYRLPFAIENLSEQIPLTVTIAEGTDYRDLIQESIPRA